MTSDELKQITRHREKRTLEYKEAWSELPGNLFETVCAFLNRDGGVIVLGAHDDGSITEGVNPRAIDQMCKNIANVSNNAEMLNPAYLLQPEIVEVEDSLCGDKVQVIIVQVPASSQAHRFKNKYYDRSVDGDYELRTDAQISQLYLRKSADYTEDTIFPYLKIEHFKEGIVNKAKNLIRSMREDHPWLALDEMEFFKTANLYRQDTRTGEEGFTLAALMLFGKDEIIQSALPYYKIDCVLRRINTTRYDDRYTSFGNIIDGYTEVMNFFERCFPDPFFMEGDQRVSLRDKVFREVVSNLLIHREYLNPAFTMIDVRIDHVLVQNASRPLRTGVLTPDNFTPHPKNPHLANFFVQMGRGEHLGSGVLNLYHYAPLYMGAEPTITDDDMFRIRLNIAEAKRAELAMMPINALVNTTDSKSMLNSTEKQEIGQISIQQAKEDHTENHTENHTEKYPGLSRIQREILTNLKINPSYSRQELSSIIANASLGGVISALKRLQELGILRRVGPDKGGRWEIVD